MRTGKDEAASVRKGKAASEEQPSAAREGGRSSVLLAQSLTYEGDPNFMMSLARGLGVIVAFDQQRRPLTVAQLSHRTGLSRAAARRCVYTLARLGFVHSEDERHFSLSPRILSLGYAYLSSSPLSTLAQPILERVSATLHESSSIATLDGEEIVYLARSKTTRRIMSIDLGVGSRLPAYCTSMGRVLLAALPPAELKPHLQASLLTKRTAHTVTGVARLREVLEDVRRKGYAVVDQELEIGLRSFAVPVRDPRGKVVAALNIGTHSSRYSVAELESKAYPVLRDAAYELGMALP